VITGAYVSFIIPRSDGEHAGSSVPLEPSLRTPSPSFTHTDTRQRDENGKPWVLDSVRKAEDILHEQESDKEYLAITVSISNGTIESARH
jgi:hypothetical protein